MKHKQKRKIKKAVKEAHEFFEQFHREVGPYEFIDGEYRWEVNHVNDKGEDIMDVLLRSEP